MSGWNNRNWNEDLPKKIMSNETLNDVHLVSRENRRLLENFWENKPKISVARLEISSSEKRKLKIENIVCVYHISTNDETKKSIAEVLRNPNCYKINVDRLAFLLLWKLHISIKSHWIIL